jgi:hypothetical protein
LIEDIEKRTLTLGELKQDFCENGGESTADEDDFSYSEFSFDIGVDKIITNLLTIVENVESSNLQLDNECDIEKERPFFFIQKNIMSHFLFIAEEVGDLLIQKVMDSFDSEKIVK